MLSQIKNDPFLSCCYLCSKIVNLEHILFECEFVLKLRANIVDDNPDYFGNWTLSNWVFGSGKNRTNILVWVLNFLINKAFLQASSGIKQNINLTVKSTLAHYTKIFPEIDMFDLSFLDGVDSNSCIHR